jgi:hypothetical protein
MLIEYEIKFQQDSITITQRIEPGGPDEVPVKQPALTPHAAVRSENHLNRVAPKVAGTAGDRRGAGPGDGIRGNSPGAGLKGAGPGDGIRGNSPGAGLTGAGPGDGIRGNGPGDGIRGNGPDDSILAGRVIVLGPVIINYPSGSTSNS